MVCEGSLIRSSKYPSGKVLFDLIEDFNRTENFLQDFESAFIPVDFFTSKHTIKTLFSQTITLKSTKADYLMGVRYASGLGFFGFFFLKILSLSPHSSLIPDGRMKSTPF